MHEYCNSVLNLWVVVLKIVRSSSSSHFVVGAQQTFIFVSVQRDRRRIASSSLVVVEIWAPELIIIFLKVIIFFLD